MYDSLRMQSVQTPIIPVVGELIRANPGTISLGQGVAYYGPPPEAAQYLQKFWGDPQNHKCIVAIEATSVTVEAMSNRKRTTVRKTGDTGSVAP